MSKHTFDTLMETANECHNFLDAARIPHVFIGGLAVRLHRHTRETDDVDLLVRSGDEDRIQQETKSANYRWWKHKGSFYSFSPTGVRVDFRCEGTDAGNGKVSLPDPQSLQSREIISGLPVLALARLIETKLACGNGYDKHCKDVEGLIIANNLPTSYGNSLHESVRAAFHQIMTQISWLRTVE